MDGVCVCVCVCVYVLVYSASRYSLYHGGAAALPADIYEKKNTFTVICFAFY